MNELLASDRSGYEPTVSIGGKPTPISMIAYLADLKGYNAGKLILALGQLRQSLLRT